MDIQIKPMKLIFFRDDTYWGKRIVDMNDNIIFEQTNIKIFEELMTKEYFDDWEFQMKNMPSFNIIETIRFI